MIGRQSGANEATAIPPIRRWIILGLLLAGHVAFAAACTPVGVRSGQWRVPGLRDPDCLVFAAGGAIYVHLLVLYPLWAAFGPGNFLRRFAITALLCLAVEFAELGRAWWRGDLLWPLAPIVVPLLLFSLLTFGFHLAQRWCGWRIVVPGDPQRHSRGFVFRPRFSLRILLELFTFAACGLALWRFYHPQGLQPEFAADCWQVIVRGWQAISFLFPRILTWILMLLPTATIPWIFLSDQGRSKFALLMAGIGWIVLDCGLIWLMNWLGQDRDYASVPELILTVQLSASAAALVSAAAVRFCGYRIRSSGKILVTY